MCWSHFWNKKGGFTDLVFEKNPFQKQYVLPLFAIDLYGKILKIKTKAFLIKKRLYTFFFFTYVLVLIKKYGHRLTFWDIKQN